MNTNLKLRTNEFCYVYSSYRIEIINGRKYIMPDEESRKNVVSVTEHIDEELIKLLHIGKKAFFL